MKFGKEEFLKWAEENNGNSHTRMGQSTCLGFETNQGISMCILEFSDYRLTATIEVFTVEGSFR